MSDEKRDDPLDNFIAVLFVIVVAAILISIFYIDVWYSIRSNTFKAFSAMPESVRTTLVFYKKDLANTIPLMSEDLIYNKKNFATYYQKDSTGTLKKIQIDNAARWLFFPWVILFVSIMLYLELSIKRGKINKPGSKERAMYNYARTQMEIWPFIKVVAPIMEKIVKNDNLDEGVHAMPKLPIIWMDEEGLLNEVKTKQKRDLLTVSQRSQFTLDRPKAYGSLVKNLGRHWTGIDDLTFVERCVFSVLVPHVYGQVKESRLNNRKILAYFGKKITSKDKKMLMKMEAELAAHVDACIARYQKSFSMPYFSLHDFDDPYDPIVSSFQTMDTEKDMKEKGDRLISETLLQHRYVKTVFFSLMVKSWTYGVLAPSELLWVKGLDRDMYYVLSQQGRNSAFVEVAGAWSHYLCESSYGFKMLSPQVYPAIRALDLDLFKTHDNYIPHEDYDDSAKWDKLVPDGIGASAGFTASKPGNTTSKLY